MSDFSRRTVVRGTAWSVPVIALVAQAPAFAASPQVCNPTAECKEPGLGSNTKDYRVRTNCVSGGAITGVRVYEEKNDEWIVASYEASSNTWLALGFPDSRRFRLVEITTESEIKQYRVGFPPC